MFKANGNCLPGLRGGRDESPTKVRTRWPSKGQVWRVPGVRKALDGEEVEMLLVLTSLASWKKQSTFYIFLHFHCFLRYFQYYSYFLFLVGSIFFLIDSIYYSGKFNLNDFAIPHCQAFLTGSFNLKISPTFLFLRNITLFKWAGQVKRFRCKTMYS